MLTLQPAFESIEKVVFIYQIFFFFIMYSAVKAKAFLLQQNQQGGNTCSNYLKQAGNKGCLSSHAV